MDPDTADETPQSTPTFAVVAGGGTAGHVLPGLAIGRALVDAGHPPASIRFMGAERGLEARLVPEAGFPVTLLPGRGITRSLSLANIQAVAGILIAVVHAIALVRRWRPRVVVVLGGYASVPCAVAAVLWRVPIVVTEQNARASAANRLAGRFAKACAVPFDGTDLPRAVVTGNPVRDEILAVDRAVDRDRARTELDLPRDRTVVAVFSGSLGSRTINRAIVGLAQRWADRDDVAIHHVVGNRDFDEVVADVGEQADTGIVHHLVRYEDRMDLLLAAADVAVCRAGGSTVAELAEVGLGGVLVPLPIATRDHQTANASPLVEAGAAVLVPDDELSIDRLEAELAPLMAEPGRLGAMGRAAHRLAHPAAAADVAALAEEHARR